MKKSQLLTIDRTMEHKWNADGAASGTHAVFPTTNWTLIAAATQADRSEGWKALQELCRVYWYPLYAVARRCGHSPADAEDFVQGFFVHFLAKSSRLAAADSDKGSFRGFLKTCLKNYIFNRQDYDKCRVQGQVVVSIDSLAGELQYGSEPQAADAMELFDVGWAGETFRRAVESLLVESKAGQRDKGAERLLPFLTCSGEPGELSEVARELGIEDGALRTRISRLRKRLGEVIREAVSLQVARQKDSREELEYLFSVLARYYAGGKPTGIEFPQTP